VARISSTTSRYPACVAYEIYDVLVAELRGIGDDEIATIHRWSASARISSSKKPSLTTLELALVSGGVLPEQTYQQAVHLIGEEGTAEFIYLVGLYCMGSVTLNGFDVPIPARRRQAPRFYNLLRLGAG
jgi:4-carboxymuconolactone decarboxylase